MGGAPVSQLLSQQQSTEVELEQENYRKKVKRLTGELEVLETYFSSFETLVR
jgi:uncharacterized protein Veg